MNVRVTAAAAAAVMALLSTATAAQAARGEDYRLTPLTLASGALHGAVCRAAVTSQPGTPAVEVRSRDSSGRIIETRSVALYGARRERAGGCGYFNVAAAQAPGQIQEICLTGTDICVRASTPR